MQPPAQNSKLSVPEALQRYWANLIGVAVFPFLFFIGAGIFHISFWILAPCFFGACGLAAWPYLTRRAPYTFWVIACAIWAAGGFVAFILLLIVKAFAA